MFCISLSYKNSDLKTREYFAKRKTDFNNLKKYVLLSTCNRFELYGTSGLYECLNADFEKVKDKVFVYNGKDAISHLFSVACGLDSMVLGEDEILGQVKNAYAESLKLRRTDYELNTVFKAAITCAKKVKTDTLLSKTSVSVATIASSLCTKYRRGEGDDSQTTVLVIGGSGEIGSKVIKDLLSIGGFKIYATVRRHGIDSDVIKIDYSERYKYASDADIIISATASPHFTITKNKLKNKKRLYLDLAVPRDIDPEINGVITIDDLKAEAKKNNIIKRNEVAFAREIIDSQCDRLLKELYFHELMPLECDDTVKKFVYSFRDTASAEEFGVFCDVIKRMQNDSLSAF